MKRLFRSYLINLVALEATTKLLPGLTYDGGLKALAMGALGLMLINLAVIPLLKIMFLPLNLLTLGLFAWLVNVVGIYLLTTFVPSFKLVPYTFPGLTAGGFSMQSVDLNILEVAICASFLVGLVSHFLHWLVEK